MNKEIEIPEGYEARIEGNKVIFEPKENEDERIERDILKTLRYGLASEESALMPGAKTTLREAIAYLEKQNEQKLAEWSEDDENMLKTIFDSLNTYAKSLPFHCLKKVVEDEINWLKSKSFRPQSKQEWSEDDQRVCDGIIAILEAWDRSHTAPGGIQSLVPKYCLWLETHLKSLSSSSPQLHWKPSEEQMKHLKGISVGWHPDLKDCQVLSSLYNDLQKLL